VTDNHLQLADDDTQRNDEHSHVNDRDSQFVFEDSDANGARFWLETDYRQSFDSLKTAVLQKIV
jgi:hypothetical protein